MAIYRCEIKPLSRSDGRNAIVAACYRVGATLIDDCDFFTKEKRVHDYSRRKGVVASGIILPEGAPVSFADRQILWTAQERAENKKNSRIAREAVIALPHEMTDAERKELVMTYAHYLKDRYGVACDYAIHIADKGGDNRNDHAHIMFTTRRVTAEGLGEKTRELDDRKQGKAEIKHLRKAWEVICNEALAKGNYPVLIAVLSRHETFTACPNRNRGQ